MAVDTSTMFATTTTNNSPHEISLLSSYKLIIHSSYCMGSK